MNFPCYEKGQVIAATSSGLATALTGTAERVKAARDVLLWNPGPLDVQVFAGDVNGVADAQSAPLPAGAIWTYDKGQTAFLAAYCASGTQNIVAILGQGS